ncbi:hypothetical protein AMTRI_Chr02g211630 [Amborella trichopoda]
MVHASCNHKLEQPHLSISIFLQSFRTQENSGKLLSLTENCSISDALPSIEMDTYLKRDEQQRLSITELQIHPFPSSDIGD